MTEKSSDLKDTLRQFAIDVQREVCVRCSYLPAKTEEDLKWLSQGPVSVAALDTVHRYFKGR